MVCMPASNEMAKKGMPRQMLTNCTENIAQNGEPSQMIFSRMIPAVQQEAVEDTELESNIHSQPSALNEVGSIHGRSIAPRNTFLRNLT